MFDIKENLKELPDSPGVYIHKDKLGQIIYVGKAISLKNRVRQYFQSSRNHDAKVRSMVSNIAEFEYITVGSELEALILECNLIKKYRPKYNVLLRDDKTYPYIKVTTNEEYPRVVKTRRVDNDGCKYFGPYSDTGAVNQIVDLLPDIYSLKRCSAKSFPEGFKPCLNYHINQCGGICTGTVSPEEYGRKINEIISFLNGKHKVVTDGLREKMLKASEAMDFERAAELRDYIRAIDAISEKQRVTMPGAKDMDVVLPVKGTKHYFVALFFVRDGKLSGRETYAIQAGEDEKNTEIVAAFIKQYYAECMSVPKEIILSEEPAECALIEEYLSGIHEKNIRIVVPQKGDKKALLDLAKKNVIEMTKTIEDKERNKQERAFALGSELNQVISRIAGQKDSAYAGRQFRIEAYDISNTNGIDSVGAMVVFVGLQSVKKDYRRFKIRTVEGPNDYGSLQEVIYRRFKRALEGDPGFSVMPDALFIDGGKNQVSVVLQMLYAMELNIPVVGMAKDDHHRTRALIFLENQHEAYGDGSGACDYTELVLRDQPLLFKYTGTIQEEVHRFAIEYHKGLRGKSVQRSALDDIPNVGPARRNALLSYFGSIEKIRGASYQELLQVDGITSRVAESIIEYFN